MRVKRLHIDTYLEPVVYMRRDCHVCRSEGFEAQSRIELRCGEARVIATLNVVTDGIVGIEEVGLSEAAWRTLGAHEGDMVQLSHPAPLQSFSLVRAKLYGKALNDDSAKAIMGDIVAGNYSDIEIASFLTACAGERLDQHEIIALTRAMVDSGTRLDWGKTPIVDKHCVGGLPGNRTTILIVPIVAACGLTIPKTSSRAITSPAGTADTMETLAPVMLDMARMRQVVAAEGGCIAWGGSVNLSPADDLLIRIERPLDLDSDGQLVASVLSKKLAAGSTHVLIDLPVGPTAKVRSLDAAHRLSTLLCGVGQALDLNVATIFTDGSQPVGRGIGPALEAYDVLAVLRGEANAPDDLRQRALLLAGRILEMGLGLDTDTAARRVREALEGGAAWRKFQAICDGQGGMRVPPRARHTFPVLARSRCRIVAFDNRRLARIAKLAGAPRAAAAGVLLHGAAGSHFGAGDPLFTIHAETPGELAYARDYAESQPDVVLLEKET